VLEWCERGRFWGRRERGGCESWLLEFCWRKNGGVLPELAARRIVGSLQLLNRELHPSEAQGPSASSLGLGRWACIQGSRENSAGGNVCYGRVMALLLALV